MAGIDHVGVIGAGLAGLSAALAIGNAGLRVDVFEAASAPGEWAAPIDVVPNLLRDLAALGIGEDCVRRGFPYHGVDLLDDDGRALLQMETARLAGPQFPSSLGMVYGDLLDRLRVAAVAQGARLHFAMPVRDVHEGHVVVTESGERRDVDWVVVAAGSQSATLSTAIGPTMSVESLPQQWCHALLPRPRAVQRASWVFGKDFTKAMLVPVGARRVGIALLQSAGAAATPAAMRAVLATQGRLMDTLATYWTDDVPTLRRPVRTGLLEGPWHANGVLRIGHSAHVLPPHFGQAAAQVVEDAVVLGELLRDRPERDALLEAFMARRGERARSVHAVVTQAARWDLRPEAETDLPALAASLAPIVEQRA
jgi:2-polyprenyl-6-methoxyphenol hydroxylase-like FAD-dependent oxidoreductase